ncbi:unnamed protein product [Dovyalis caffra]|uniref:non-specific serine/threonine protein kinase n=1 Tax=Dovyalis caffra TaxID=77055 RepID=A0AAV1SEI0_9ROSI|nr:unnamed protein product [Dovyalis caffra]
MIKPLYFFLLSLFFINISYGIGDDSDPSSANCPDQYESCGDNLTIKYPFWRTPNDSTSNQYCGYPYFGLSCSEYGKTILRLPNDHTFLVKDINYPNHSITLVDIDLDGNQQYCPRPRHNLTLETLPLHYSKSDLTLSFHFNCTSGPFPWPPKPPIECLRFEAKRSYVNVLEGNEKEQDNWFGICEEHVRVMVLRTPLTNNDMITTEFGRAMDQGFMLDWGTAKECGACEASDGHCGSSDSKKDLLCFCKDGKVRSKHCGGMQISLFNVISANF